MNVEKGCRGSQLYTLSKCGAGSPFDILVDIKLYAQDVQWLRIVILADWMVMDCGVEVEVYFVF